jgi:cytochrome c peroxidase
MSDAKVRLGRHFFYDKRLSGNGAQSCASCHRQELAFTDGRATALGSTGEAHPRGSMSLVNVAYNSSLTWANAELASLEEQVLIPIFSAEPVELGMHGREEELLERLRADDRYVRLFEEAFPSEPVDVRNVAKALASFVRSIVSARSPYDRYYRGGEPDAISDAAKRGEALFFTDGLAGCFRCHSGSNFTDASFHNTGLYNLAGELSYPTLNPGLYQQTNDPKDVGRFRTPSVRNVAVTAPYMHDGSVATLEDVLDHYEAGGRTIAVGPYAGRGAENPNRDVHLRPVPFTDQNRRDLVTFLESLTDEALLTDERFSDPWRRSTARIAVPSE